TARRARSTWAARSANRLTAIASEESRSAQKLWWSKIWCGSTNDVRAPAAVSALVVRNVAPLSAAKSQREEAAAQTRRRARRTAMGANRVAVGHPPHRVVIADPAAELGQLRVATYLVVVQRAVG